MKPLQLVSLWDMLLPYGALFTAWANFQDKWILRAITEEHASQPIGGVFLNEFRDDLRRFLEAFAGIDLPMTRIAADRLLSSLQESEHGEEVMNKIYALSQRLSDELQSQQFLYVRETAAPYYNTPLAGWGDAPDRLPSAMHDIEEAGKCLAVERHTACVFHLMRALEIGLKAQAKELGVTVPRDQWGHYIDQIEAKVRAISSATPKPANWQETEQFHSEAAAHFRALKNAWRNAAMHGRGTYGEEQARTIYDNVRGFMRHLATRLTEPAETL